MLQIAHVLIENGETDSQEVDVRAGRPVAVQMPASFDGGALTFQATPDAIGGGGENAYQDVFLDDGTQLSVVVAGGTYVCFSAATQLALAGCKKLIVISDAAESAERELVLLLDPADA